MATVKPPGASGDCNTTEYTIRIENGTTPFLLSFMKAPECLIQTTNASSTHSASGTNPNPVGDWISVWSDVAQMFVRYWLHGEKVMFFGLGIVLILLSS